MASRSMSPHQVPEMSETQRVKFSQWFDKVAHEKASVVREGLLRDGIIKVPVESGKACTETKKRPHTLEACSQCRRMTAIDEELHDARQERARKWLRKEDAAGRLSPPYTEQQIQENCMQHVQEKVFDRQQDEELQRVGKLVRDSGQDAAPTRVIYKRDEGSTTIPMITLTAPPRPSFSTHAMEVTSMYPKQEMKTVSHKRQRSSLSDIVQARSLPKSSRLVNVILAQEFEDSNTSTRYTRSSRRDAEEAGRASELSDLNSNSAVCTMPEMSRMNSKHRKTCSDQINRESG